MHELLIIADEQTRKHKQVGWLTTYTRTGSQSFQSGPLSLGVAIIQMKVGLLER
jgi:hypothetical protein